MSRRKVSPGSKPRVRVPARRSHVTTEAALPPLTTGGGWSTTPYDPGQALATLERDRARARHAYRADTWVRRLVHLLVSDMVGDTGMVPITPYDDLARLWSDWCQEADSRGRTSMLGLQSLAATDLVVAGEAFGRLRDRRPEDGLVVPLQVEPIRPERVPVTTEDVGNGVRRVGGLLVDPLDRPLSWAVQGRDPIAPAAVPAREMLHMFSPEGSEDVRGFPWLTTALETARGLRDYDRLELERKRTAARYTGAFYTPGNDDDDEIVTGAMGATGANPDGSVKVEQPTGGHMTVLPPGFKPEFFAVPDVGANYPVFRKTNLSQIAATVGATYDLLTGDAKSDRILRANLVRWLRSVGLWQRTLLVERWCAPTWRRFVAAAYASGAWSPPAGGSVRDAMRCDWQGPAHPHVHPVQEIAAELMAVRGGVDSRDRVTRRRGGDRRTIDLENSRAASGAEAVNVAYDTHTTAGSPDATAAIIVAALEAEAAETAASNAANATGDSSDA